MELPWYDRLEAIVAPTEHAANIALIVLGVSCFIILWKGSPLLKAAFVVYLVSP